MNRKKGITRNVFLTKRYAIKIPTFYNWRLFLTGLLANLHEKLWWDASGHDERLCPIVFSCPGGWFAIMRRAEVLGEEDEVPYEKFEGLPLDPKPANFGWLDGKLVMLDYGS